VPPRINHFVASLDTGLFFGLGTTSDESLLSDTYFLPYTYILDAKSTEMITPTLIDINLLPDEGMTVLRLNNDVLI